MSPIKVMSLKEELEEMQNNVALYKASDERHLHMEGPDATDYLQRMVTNEVKTQPIGEGRHNALLDRKGHPLSLFFLIRLSENSYHLITPPQLKEKTAGLLKKYKVIERFEIKDVSQEWGVYWVVGSPVPPALLPAIWQETIYKIPVRKILYPKNNPPPLGDLPSVSRQAIDLLRMEAGIPEYGVDIDETHILLEANLEHCYKRQKGCYPGQEVIERILAYGKGQTPKKLVTLLVEGEREIPPKTAIWTADNQKAGETTSALFNPLRNQTVVLAYLENKFVNSGLTLVQREGQYLLTPLPTPALDP